MQKVVGSVFLPTFHGSKRLGNWNRPVITDLGDGQPDLHPGELPVGMQPLELEIIRVPHVSKKTANLFL